MDSDDARARGVDSAAGLTSASSLRVRLAAPHELSTHLQRTISVVDAVDAVSERTQSILARARESVTSMEGGPLDRLLASIDQAADGPQLGESSILREGVTLRGAAGTLDIRPIGAADLGAVVSVGRSHRLSDLRSGGTLDPVSNQSGALRSIDAAADEVGGVRMQLAGFRSGSLVPAQRDALAAIRSATDTGPAAMVDMVPIAAGIRDAMSSQPSSLPLAAHEHSRVLALLT